MVREIEFLDHLDLSVLAQRRTRHPYGLSGGGKGAPGGAMLRRCGQTSETIEDSSFTVAVESGDVLFLLTPGGGAWGPLQLS